MVSVSKVSVKNIKIKTAINNVLKPLGGMKHFIKPGETILLKPNFNTPDPLPAASDPDFIQAVSEIVYSAGAKLVMIGESSMLRLNTCKVFEKKKMYKLEGSPKCPIRLYSFDEKEWVTKIIPNGKYLKKVTVPKMLYEVDKIILLPCMKTHFIAQFTGALKLAIGFMKPSERIALHMGHVQEKVAEMNTIYKPDLIIMDGRKCFITKGPSQGLIKEPNLILASKSRVAIDIEAINEIKKFDKNDLRNFKAEELVQIKYSKELGIK
ncbi:DUF362 domain-containing protein [bacterium]|nr:DUF362 domain-containing protein [bacterium]